MTHITYSSIVSGRSVLGDGECANGEQNLHASTDFLYSYTVCSVLCIASLASYKQNFHNKH